MKIWAKFNNNNIDKFLLDERFWIESIELRKIKDAKV